MASLRPGLLLALWILPSLAAAQPTPEAPPEPPVSVDEGPVAPLALDLAAPGDLNTVVVNRRHVHQVKVCS